MVVITSEGRRPEAPKAICEIALSAVDQLVLEVATGGNYRPEVFNSSPRHCPTQSTQARVQPCPTLGWGYVDTINVHIV